MKNAKEEQRRKEQKQAIGNKESFLAEIYLSLTWLQRGLWSPHVQHSVGFHLQSFLMAPGIKGEGDGPWWGRPFLLALPPTLDSVIVGIF